MAGVKRKHGEELSDAVYSNKSRSRPSIEARVDPTYGQRSAIPGLDDDTTMEGEEDDLTYDEEMDALAYLRAVRHEASGIPNLLVAPRILQASDSREIYENGDGDFRGHYEDGAYIASSKPAWASSDPVEAVELDQQLRYFDSILSRYEFLRTQLQQSPPPEAIQNLGEDYPTNVGKLTVAVVRLWKWKMQTVDPRPAQIASMNKSTVLRLLGLLTSSILKRGAEVKVGVSRWVWSLLARLPDRGELTSEEIGVVRELGKKAVLIGVSLRENKIWEEGMREVEKELDDKKLEESVDIADENEIMLDLEDEVEFEEDPEINVDPWITDTPTDDTFIDHKLVVSEDTSAIADDMLNGVHRPGPATSTDDALIEAMSNGINPIEEAQRAESTSEEEGEISSNDSSDNAEPLATGREELLAQLDQEQTDNSDTRELEQANIQQAKVEKQSAQWNTKATVDMIITVAGEIYGQRDLLEFRGAWED